MSSTKLYNVDDEKKNGGGGGDGGVEDEDQDQNRCIQSLSSNFQKILDLYDELQHSSLSTNDPQFQKKVTTAITQLESMTRTVNQLGLFSTNESIEEVTTSDLKYLLLPALLADFSLRNLQRDRLEMLEHAEVYYRDYIKRLNDYNVCDIALERSDDDNDGGDDDDGNKPAPIGKIRKDPLVSSAIFRESKITRYREAKRLEEQLVELRRLICLQENSGSGDGEGSTIVDDEVERKFYLTLITRWLNRAMDELDSIKSEKPMAKMRASMLNNAAGRGGSTTTTTPTTSTKSSSFKPIIITRDQAQKRVFGQGYPSVSTVTVDEFVTQKINEGTLAFQDRRVYHDNSLYSWANDPAKKQAEDDEEAERKERAQERDDEDELRKERQWDDWKDEHRRGEGNRMNMG